MVRVRVRGVVRIRGEKQGKERSRDDPNKKRGRTKQTKPTKREKQVKERIELMDGKRVERMDGGSLAGKAKR